MAIAHTYDIAVQVLSAISYAYNIAVQVLSATAYAYDVAAQVLLAISYANDIAVQVSLAIKHEWVRKLCLENIENKKKPSPYGLPLEREDTRNPRICVFEEDISTLEFNKKILE